MILNNYIYTQTQCPESLVFKALPTKYSKVDEYLIRGPHPSIADLFCLRKEGVNQIFDFRHIGKFGFKFIEKYLCKLMGIKYNRIAYSNLYGKYPDKTLFENVASSVRTNGVNGGKTLMHCNSGRHRTAQFSAFYKLTKGESLDSVKASQKDDYFKLVDEVLQEQIFEKNYFSRTKIKYKGLNIIRLLFAKRNNRVFDGLNKAHSLFVEMLNK